MEILNVGGNGWHAGTEVYWRQRDENTKNQKKILAIKNTNRNEKYLVDWTQPTSKTEMQSEERNEKDRTDYPRTVGKRHKVQRV